MRHLLQLVYSIYDLLKGVGWITVGLLHLRILIYGVQEVLGLREHLQDLLSLLIGYALVRKYLAIHSFEEPAHLRMVYSYFAIVFLAVLYRLVDGFEMVHALYIILLFGARLALKPVKHRLDLRADEFLCLGLRVILEIAFS